MADCDILHEHVWLAGPHGKLEGRLAYPATGDPRQGVLIAGPHPLLGGDMQNNVVRALGDGLAGVGCVTLCYNYGGIGRSEGGPSDWPSAVSRFWKDHTFDEERDWIQDTACAAESLSTWCEGPLILLGYSFGCFAAVCRAATASPQAMVLISPNPRQHDFGPLCESEAPLLVMHSEHDFSCSKMDLLEWFAALREPKTRIQLDAGEHFFRGKEEAVVHSVVTFLDDCHLLEAVPT